MKEKSKQSILLLKEPYKFNNVLNTTLLIETNCLEKGLILSNLKCSPRESLLWWRLASRISALLINLGSHRDK